MKPLVKSVSLSVTDIVGNSHTVPECIPNPKCHIPLIHKYIHIQAKMPSLTGEIDWLAHILLISLKSFFCWYYLISNLLSSS